MAQSVTEKLWAMVDDGDDIDDIIDTAEMIKGELAKRNEAREQDDIQQNHSTPTGTHGDDYTDVFKVDSLESLNELRAALGADPAPDGDDDEDLVFNLSFDVDDDDFLEDDDEDAEDDFDDDDDDDDDEGGDGPDYGDDDEEDDFEDDDDFDNLTDEDNTI